MGFKELGRGLGRSPSKISDIFDLKIFFIIFLLGFLHGFPLFFVSFRVFTAPSEGDSDMPGGGGAPPFPPSYVLGYRLLPSVLVKQEIQLAD